MNRKIRNIVFVILGIGFYLLWNYGGELIYGKFIAFGIEHIVAKKSDITSVNVNYLERDDQHYIVFKYPKGESGVSMESYLPIILLFAWQISLFFDNRISIKKALWLFVINFLIIYLLQIIYPLVVRSKSSFMFIGTQIFSFLVFFIILKDTLIVRLKNKT